MSASVLNLAPTCLTSPLVLRKCSGRVSLNILQARAPHKSPGSTPCSHHARAAALILLHGCPASHRRRTWRPFSASLSVLLVAKSFRRYKNFNLAQVRAASPASSRPFPRCSPNLTRPLLREPQCFQRADQVKFTPDVLVSPRKILHLPSQSCTLLASAKALVTLLQQTGCGGRLLKKILTRQPLPWCCCRTLRRKWHTM